MRLFTRVIVGLARWKPFEKLITSTRPGRALSRRFVAGDTLEEAVGVSKRLNQEGFLVSLDLLGEEVSDREAAVRATEEYLEGLERIRIEGLNANVSVKPTQLGLSIDEGLAFENISRLAAAAAAIGTTVTIDMEDSRYTETTVRLYQKAQQEHGNLGIALQSCMKRTPEDLALLTPLGGHIRLCKGAYVEPEGVALTTKPAVNAAYAAQLQTLMASEETRPAIASHDSILLDLARKLATDREGPFEFQMLYGVRPDVQKSLIEEGHELRVYLPYGSEWYPYLTRRLAERPSNLWLFIRALFRK